MSADVVDLGAWDYANRPWHRCADCLRRGAPGRAGLCARCLAWFDRQEARGTIPPAPSPKGGGE